MACPTINGGFVDTPERQLLWMLTRIADIDGPSASDRCKVRRCAAVTLVKPVRRGLGPRQTFNPGDKFIDLGIGLQKWPQIETLFA
jgi:hypothetical protein